ncbi:DUF3231 family protein [Gracilibacillus thailandensis]|uniref:DUF3231 family protein n=1 Tax=Gracilibacillus thailandensis TaxID=563735 RepID=A0A6N7QYN8_9BACI|nr:DUF3231 family protein [Gracilibacillus thailandensis]MRI65995.1 DUF3231 family protein [Gracilibacillus thailandensis]
MRDKIIHLTSGEIATLWTGYMNDSMSKCVLKFMLQHIEDPDIKPVVQNAYDISSSHLDSLLTIFEQDNYVQPNGFVEQDVNLDSPWLYTDLFCLSYINHIAKVGMVSYSGSVAMSDREDIRNYFTNALNESIELFNRSTEIALAKGVNARHPYIEVPKETNYVDSKKYMSGLNPLTQKRPLNAIEISHLYMNIETNTIGLKLCLSFAQTSPTKEVQDFMLRAKKVSQKHIKVFTDTLLENDMDVPEVPDLAISDSTTKTFSDKLIMFHMSLLMSAGIGNYATAAAASQRSDLMVDYERLSLEVSKLAKSGADIMIENNWLEQPPRTKDREKLARNKEG